MYSARSLIQDNSRATPRGGSEKGNKQAAYRGHSDDKTNAHLVSPHPLMPRSIFSLTRLLSLYASFFVCEVDRTYWTTSATCSPIQSAVTDTHKVEDKPNTGNLSETEIAFHPIKDGYFGTGPSVELQQYDGTDESKNGNPPCSIASPNRGLRRVYRKIIPRESKELAHTHIPAR
ncbi:hypothetical protein CBL_00526 [Carabus blaptoides fortunei]